MSSLKRFALENRFVVTLLLITGFMLVMGGMSMLVRKEDNDAARRRTRHEQTFQQDIERAKRATGDPCATVFYEYVMPPAGLGGKPALVMMGQEISISFDPSAYFLWPKGDSVELWINFPPPTGDDRRLGEKFAPDSTKCKDK